MSGFLHSPNCMAQEGSPHVRDTPGASRESSEQQVCCGSTAGGLTEAASCPLLFFGSEKLSSLFGMTNKATVPCEESCQHLAMALAMGGRPPSSLLREKGVGNFSQLFGCFTGDALYKRRLLLAGLSAVPSTTGRHCCAVI